MKKVLSILGTASVVLGSASLANAASFLGTEFSITFDTPPIVFDQTPLGVCAFVQICSPGVLSIVPDVNPNLPTPPEPYINDTGFPIIGIIADLPENRPQGPGLFVGGVSNIFSDINISNNGQQLSFTQGIIGVNEVFFADFQTNPEADSTLFITLVTTEDHASTPEPSLLMGMLFTSLMSIPFSRHRKLNKTV